MASNFKQTLTSIFFLAICFATIAFGAAHAQEGFFAQSQKAYKAMDYFQAINLGIKAKAEADRKGNESELAKISLHLAKLYVLTDSPGNAAENYNLALSVYTKSGNLSMQSRILSQLGDLHLRKGDNSLALRNFLKGYYLGKTNNIDSITFKHAGSLGVLYCKMGNFPMAKQYLLEAAELHEKCKDYSGLAYTNGNLAMLFDQQRIDSLAVIYYNKTLSYCKSVKDSSCLANVYNNLGVFYEDRNKKMLALDYYLKSLACTDEKSQDAASVINCNVANIFLEKENLAKAAQFADKALALAKKSGFTEDERDAIEVQRKIAEKKQDWETAYRLQAAGSRLTLELQKKNSNSEFMREEMENRLRLRDKEQQFEKKLMKEKMELISIRQNHYRNLMQWVMLFLLLAVIIVSYFLAKLNKTNGRLKHTLENMREVNRQQEALTGIVAHDLKTPLSQIIGLANLLKMEEGYNESQEEIVRNMLISTSSGIQLINDMLMVNRMENLPDTPLQPILLGEVADEVAHAHRDELMAKQLTLIRNTEVKYMVDSTHDWCFRMIDNLLTNAIKFSPPGELIRIDIEKKDNYVALHVKDNGPGIDKNELPLLFKKFQRLSNRPTMGENSYGLGLYIVKFLADKNGVQVLVDTKPGKGTTFCLLFPEPSATNS